MNSAKWFCGENGGEYMAITINARQFTVTPDIRAHVEGALTPVINDQVLKVSSANVVIDYENKQFTVSLVVNCKYHVFTATNGKEALSRIPYVQPLIVLSDVMMPEMRGDDLCVSIKSNIDTSHIAVVLVSALSDQQSIISGLSVKADAYITKPFDTQILILTIRNIVESRNQLKCLINTLDAISANATDTATELDIRLMTEMKEIINNNLSNNDFTVDTLAYKLRISRTSLYNKIKVLTGYTPSDLIRLYRIDKAKSLLQTHSYTVTEIAEMVGFADLKYFREVFKKTVGITPSEYAKGTNK